MRIVTPLVIHALFAWVALIAPSHAFNLVTNGGFETGDFSGWSLNGTPSTLFAVTDFDPHSGEYMMVIADYETENDQIYQVVPTTSGELYFVEFWLRNLGIGEDRLQVFWEGDLVLEQQPIQTAHNVWAKFTVPVTATTNGSELRLGGFDVPLAINFDDISVTTIPEPSSLVLSAAGIALTTLRTMRRSKNS
jgi:hypothetical protein